MSYNAIITIYLIRKNLFVVTTIINQSMINDLIKTLPVVLSQCGSRDFGSFRELEPRGHSNDLMNKSPNPNNITFRLNNYYSYKYYFQDLFILGRLH